jgi:hypothetical protein
MAIQTRAKMKVAKKGLLLACIAILVLTLVLTGCSSAGGSQGNQIVYYPQTKIVTKQEAANIANVSGNGSEIMFTGGTNFTEAIRPGDVLTCNQSVPGAEYGFISKVTGVSNETGPVVVQVENATLEDAIDQGTIAVNQTIPLQNLTSSALWTTGVEVMLVGTKYNFTYSPTEGVTIEGYILPTTDAHVYIQASFWHGLQEFEFIFSPGLQMGAKLRVEAGLSWDKEYTIATISGLPIPIWGPVTITPSIDVVVGTDGQITATLEAGVTYERSYDVGIRYYQGSWSKIYRVYGSGVTLEPPTFSGAAEARVYAGVVLSGTAGVSYVAEATLGTTILGNIRASGEIYTPPWQWQYDLELYLSAQVFADLDLLRIAKIGWEGPIWQWPNPPYNLAYGASGRVTTQDGNGLGGVTVNFSGGQSSVTTDADGYWCKHLLSGGVIATPAETGYVFDPPSMAITGSASNLDFQASKTVQRYTLTISSITGGAVTTPGQGPFTYDGGTVVNLVATPTGGYQFTSWTGDVGTIGNVNAASTTITMNGNYTITADFATVPVQHYTLTISSGAGGTVTTPGQGPFTYDGGTVVNLVATPTGGYQFTSWTGDVGTIGNVNAPSTTITMNGNYAITANFAPGATITVIYPHGSGIMDYWGVGSTQIITWTSSGVTGNVKIDISRDAGQSWSNIANNIPNIGSYSWTVTGSATAWAKIRVTSSSNGNIWGESFGTFSITSGPWITITFPNGGENWGVGSTHTITWTSSGVANVNIGISRDGGAGFDDFISHIPNTGSYSWTVTGPATTQAKIRVTSSSDGNVWDLSNGNFTIF